MSRLMLISLLTVGCVQSFEPPTPPPLNDDVDTKTPVAVSDIRPTDEVVVTQPATPLITDFCDDPTYLGTTWSNATSKHFQIQYLPGTAADRDRDAIIERLEQAYANIREALQMTASDATATPITVTLSPSRVAAAAHGKSFGSAVPAQSRYEVIYTGAANSFEMLQYGHELTHVIEYRLDPTRPNRPAILREGLAEYLDQSGRDLHAAYARQLLSGGTESRVYVSTFESRDVTGKNYGRAGSLVQFLVERYGMTDFLEIFLASSVSWTNNCWTHPVYGCIDSPEALTTMLDGVLQSTVGESWSSARQAWEAEVQNALKTAQMSVSRQDLVEIENVVRVMDEAIRNRDVGQYRSTLEGFYCEWGGETLRAQIAERTIAAFAEPTKSQVLAAIDTGVKNFPTARVSVRRTEANGIDTFITLSMEKLPVGWRVTYGPDWY